MTPFHFPLLFYAMLKSGGSDASSGGIFWRETFYSPINVRAGSVRGIREALKNAARHESAPATDIL